MEGEEGEEEDDGNEEGSRRESEDKDEEVEGRKREAKTIAGFLDVFSRADVCALVALPIWRALALLCAPPLSFCRRLQVNDARSVRRSSRKVNVCIHA